MSLFSKLRSNAAELGDIALRRGKHYPKNQRVVDPRRTPMETQALLALESSRFEIDADCKYYIESRYKFDRAQVCYRPDPNRRKLDNIDAFRADDDPKFPSTIKGLGRERIKNKTYEFRQELNNVLNDTIVFYPEHYKDRGVYSVWPETELTLQVLRDNPQLEVSTQGRKSFHPDHGTLHGTICGEIKHNILFNIIHVCSADPTLRSHGVHCNFFVNPQTGKLHAYSPNMNNPPLDQLVAEVEKELTKLRSLISQNSESSMRLESGQR